MAKLRISFGSKGEKLNFNLPGGVSFAAEVQEDKAGRYVEYDDGTKPEKAPAE